MKSFIEEKIDQQVPREYSYEHAVEAFKRAEADNAALVEMLAEVYCALNQAKNSPSVPKDEEVGKDEEGSPYTSILSLLAQPHPGWALVDQLTRLKKVADAARPFLGMDWKQDTKAHQDRLSGLGKAFADLDCLSAGNLKVVQHASGR